uniref:cytochrome b n=1 Tax=Tropilaelaps mercedesae TaxID=418985 RepID=UPI0028D18B76|nr:cytochrome b [Tropilaelaps mercedesae]WMV02022.1 cytochrome b [Tropilaelaps mercedesae]
MSLRKNNFMKSINNLLIDMPSPSNINYMWNFGSILGICLMTQILTGLFLSFHYSCNIELSFKSISHIINDVNYGWMFRNLHANGASLFFFFIYIHISRGIYFNSFHFTMTWISGITILLILMMTAFMGYVLPWGQMSFWGATVITNLLSVIPYIGNTITLWIWGGFAINNATLTRFFSLHFILPFIILLLVIIHIMFLHNTGSNNPLGTPLNLDKIPFHPFFIWKDILGFCILFILFNFLIFIYPNILCDPENYMQANPMSTPMHIQPEWYFLFAYTILRSIPNKLGGVIGLISSILILISLSFTSKNKFNFTNFYLINKFLFWMLINLFIMLTFLGMKPVEYPFTNLSQLFTILYFSFFFLKPLFLNMKN